MMSDLQHLSFLVTRPLPQGHALCELIKARGGDAVSLPTIAFLAQDADTFRQSIATLGENHWLIFVSPQAVFESISAIRKAWPTFPPHVQFAAVGEGTAHALHEAGFNAIFPKTKDGGENLLNLPPFQAVSGVKIAIIRGEGGREILEKEFVQRGAQVTSIIAYRRILPKIDVKPYIARIKQKEINALICTSFEATQNLKNLLADVWPLLKIIPLIVVSDRIKILAQDLGFQTIWVAQNAGHHAIVDLLVKKRNELWLMK